MKKLIIASNNAHKINEIKKILKDIDLDIKSLKEENISIEVVEDGKTFEENAKKKCIEICKYLKLREEKNFIVMADDSGLEVDYLNGEPGIYSARYAGVHGDDKKNNEKLLNELANVPTEKRGAKFICQIAVCDDKDNYNSVKGEVCGIILKDIKGSDGFGYDPLFYYKPLKKTFAELTSEEKNSISHRGEALKKIRKLMNLYLD